VNKTIRKDGDRDSLWKRGSRKWSIGRGRKKQELVGMGFYTVAVLLGAAFLKVVSMERQFSFISFSTSLSHSRRPRLLLGPDRHWHAVLGRDEVCAQRPGSEKLFGRR